MPLTVLCYQADAVINFSHDASPAVPRPADALQSLASSDAEVKSHVYTAVSCFCQFAVQSFVSTCVFLSVIFAYLFTRVQTYLPVYIIGIW